MVEVSRDGTRITSQASTSLGEALLAENSTAGEATPGMVAGDKLPGQLAREIQWPIRKESSLDGHSPR
jgi:hypothetical protein